MDEKLMSLVLAKLSAIEHAMNRVADTLEILVTVVIDEQQDDEDPRRAFSSLSDVVNS